VGASYVCLVARSINQPLDWEYKPSSSNSPTNYYHGNHESFSYTSWLWSRGGCLRCERCRRLSSHEAGTIIGRIADRANANRPQQEHRQVTPHAFLHTFLRKPAEAKGVHHVGEASGPQSDRYIRRYVKPDRQNLAEAGRILIQLIV
jgi:hypothetical protein